MIISLLAFTVIVLVIALVTIGYLKYKNYKYRIDVKHAKHNNLILDQKLAVKEEKIKELLSNKNKQLSLNEEILNKLKNEINATDPSSEAQKLCLLTAQLQFQVAYEKRLTQEPQKTTDINHSFESKLEILYPELTLYEREVCTLFSLRLSAKEIMKIRNLSMDAIQLLREQIREKMSIPQGIKLEKFIQELA
ncbi:hypothetical protein IWQ47_004440 [Aquimarina sp. EL_43]|uniref:hypothetical protein n=1 Tax=unclassified Aquimarina TaxID=2627091 RepID=UPI0018C9BF7A|nr:MULTISPECIES: hypothetical protein [unclassified Aquimarina]MBG6132730.1 hypothetical protein [Aquimarina sp. EL_35]MBG6153193.1 hypothetical protein [Aquimarina sp. EL_32]MBG6171349.1 hypothetical protein [Aquimarina sp. EL_43]